MTKDTKCYRCYSNLIQDVSVFDKTFQLLMMSEDDVKLFTESLYYYYDVCYSVDKGEYLQQKEYMCPTCFKHAYKRHQQRRELSLQYLTRQIEDHPTSPSTLLEKEHEVNMLQIHKQETKRLSSTLTKINNIQKEYKIQTDALQLIKYKDPEKYDQRIHEYAFHKAKDERLESSFIKLQNLESFTIPGTTYTAISKFEVFFAIYTCKHCKSNYVWFNELLPYLNFSFGNPRLSYNVCRVCSSHKDVEYAEYIKQMTIATVDKHVLQREIDKALRESDFVKGNNFGNYYYIYRIYHPETNKCYIGQTTKAVHYRWSQHLGGQGSTEMHTELRKNPTGWQFEVLEIGDKSKDLPFILNRERYWMKTQEENGITLVNLSKPEYIDEENVINEGD